MNPYICCIRVFRFWGVYIRRVFGPKISENALGAWYFGALYPQCRYNIPTWGLGSVSVVWWPGSHHLSACLIQHCTAHEISALLIQHRGACVSGFVWHDMDYVRTGYNIVTHATNVCCQSSSDVWILTHFKTKAPFLHRSAITVEAIEQRVTIWNGWVYQSWSKYANRC